MKKLLASSVIAATAMVGVSAPAMAGLSANAGLVSDYYYRGLNLGDAAMNAGVDYEQSGFYAGVWAIDDGASSYDHDDDENYTGNDGMEYDIYFGYGMDFSGVSVGIGYTNYAYTYTADYEDEFTLSVGFKGFSLDYSFGEDHNDDSGEGSLIKDYDYEFVTLSWSGEVFGVLVGQYEIDEETATERDGLFLISQTVQGEYQYWEVSASGEIAGVDVSATIGEVFAAEYGNEDVRDTDGYMVISASKSFDL